MVMCEGMICEGMMCEDVMCEGVMCLMCEGMLCEDVTCEGVMCEGVLEICVICPRDRVYLLTRTNKMCMYIEINKEFEKLPHWNCTFANNRNKTRTVKSGD